MTDVTYRVLPAEEWGKVLPVYEEMGEPLPIPERTVMYVAEHDTEVVGYIAGQIVVCVSPLWVKPEYRGQGIAEKLAIDGYKGLPKNMQKIFITRDGHVELLASWMGFKPRIGQLFMEV
jgi:predicted N-acetyltransferase YhbS